jgi:hypothetical protein
MHNVVKSTTKINVHELVLGTGVVPPLDVRTCHEQLDLAPVSKEVDGADRSVMEEPTPKILPERSRKAIRKRLQKCGVTTIAFVVVLEVGVGVTVANATNLEMH